MENLIKALQIFLKYGNPDNPTYCEHDILFVATDPDLVSDEDKKKLDDLGFFESDCGEGYNSYKYGSC